VARVAVVIPILGLEDLRFAYGADRWAVDGVTMDIEPGERIALLGSNGAGKSTLLQLMVGLLAPCGGRMALHGKAVPPNERGSRLLRSEIALALQDPDDQIFCETVAADVRFGPRNAGLAKAEVEVRAGTALEAMGIAHLAGRRVSTLSLGEKKKVALAGSLAMRPAMLLLDEPTAGLDEAGSGALLEALRPLEGAGVSVVIATHDTALALEWARRALVMQDGRLVADGSPPSLLSDVELCRRAGLRQPLICRLLGTTEPGRNGPDLTSASADDLLLWLEQAMGAQRGVCR
jgi:cobalt/nickel transport system ATP-binding protein